MIFAVFLGREGSAEKHHPCDLVFVAQRTDISRRSGETDIYPEFPRFEWYRVDVTKKE
jgi:hypothetical protein